VWDQIIWEHCEYAIFFEKLFNIDWEEYVQVAIKVKHLEELKRFTCALSLS
jgi:hypothetical protein